MPSDANVFRPSPDALLAQMKRGERGRLKIFLGAAPGVGKTYEMLSVARGKLAQGVAVVVGIVETHGRAETQALLAGLEQIPRRRIEYRGRVLDELDLDAVLARKPALALVDELAHSNVPGSRHAKRYQDVQELLDAGIDVYTTLNVQHLESYNDLVARITGVEIRETVPDAIIERANDVELIDLPPDDLIDRLRQGKVYVPDAARRALDNYFSRGNLLALRELALRAAAERVDDDMSSFMRAHGIEGPWPARGRLLVCIDATGASTGVLRAAKRLADQRHLPWTAICVQTLGASGSSVQLEESLALASQLGAETAVLMADRVGEAIVDYARSHNAAQIVIGRSRARYRWWPRRRLAQWLFAHARDFEITVVSEAEATSTPRSRPPGQSMQSRLRLSNRETFAAVASCALAVGVSYFLEPWVGIENLALIFLLAVTFAGAYGGLGAALLSSTLCFLSYNFLFTEPRYTFAVNQRDDVAALFVFLAVSVVVGQLAGRLRRQAQDAWLGTQRVEMLYDFSRRLATAIDERDLLAAAAHGMRELMGRRCIVLRRVSDTRIESPAELVRAREFGDTDQAAADWALNHREPTGHGTGTLPAAGWYFLPVTASGQTFGVIAVDLLSSTDSIGAEQSRLLFTLQSQIAAAWERFRLREIAHDAQLQRTTESLRAALLASVSHDLRTPLVAVTGTLTALRDLAGKMSEQDRMQLLSSAIQEAGRLNRLIENLLDMTRLTHGGLTLRLAPVDVRDAVSESLSRLDDVLSTHEVSTSLPPDLPAVRADRTLLGQVLVNLIENAAKYAPGSPIEVAASVRTDGRVRIAVIDSGPGIAEADRTSVFQLFHRSTSGDTAVAGAGAGLAICKGFVEAMGGSIAAGVGHAGRGTSIEVTLPVDAPR